MNDTQEFAWAKLPPDRNNLIYAPKFEAFVVHVKSDTDIGQRLHNDPISTLIAEIDDFRRLVPKKEGVRAISVRANAELSANPVHRSEIWVVFPGNTTVVGIQYKHDTDQTDTGSEPS